MAKDEFGVDVVSLNTLFSSSEKRRLFRLPPNQRQYSWTQNHAELLWKDLSRYAKSNPNPKSPNFSYYLGNIIFSEKKTGEEQTRISSTAIDEPDWNVFLLVDGQQRLTTLSLLLAAIRDVLQKTHE